MLAYVVSFIDRQVITLLVEPIRRDLGIGDTGISLLMGLAFAIFYVAMGVPIARLSDRHSRRAIIAIGISLWSLATVCCGLARTYAQLFLARVGVGVGEAALTPAAYSMIADYFPADRLGRAIGVYATGVFLGAGLAMVLGGLVVELVAAAGAVRVPLLGTLFPWQLTFVAVGLPGLLLSLVLFVTVREPARRGLADAGGRAPVRHVAAFMWRNRATFGWIFFGYAAAGLAFNGFLAWIPEFIRRTYGWNIADAGIVFGAQLAVFGTLGVVTGGWISDALTRRGLADAPLRCAGIFFGLALPVMTVTPLLPVAWGVPMLGLLAFVISLQQALSPVALQLITPNEMRAQVVALFFVVANLVGIGGGALVVALLTDYVFRDEGALGYALSIVAAVAMTVGTVSLLLGLRPFRNSLSRSLAWRS